MSCQLYTHNDPFDSGGTKFISGTTCNGSASSYNLNFGDSVCMEAELPLVICDGLTISGSCDSPVTTPTPTPTSNPVCPEQLILTQGTPNQFSGFTGTYNRLYSWSGGSFNYVFYSQTPDTWTFDTPDLSGNYGVAYGRFDGTNYYTIFAEATTPGNISLYDGTSRTDNYAIGLLPLGSSPLIDLTLTTINNVKYPVGSGSFTFFISYPSVCPTTTPTPTPTSTPAFVTTPTQTPTNTGTPTQTPTQTSTIATTPTQTPTPSPTTPIQIFTHSAVLATCSDYCNANYNITTSTSATASYAALTIGDTIFGQGGVAGFVAYSNISTTTTAGPFRIAEINSSGVILGIYVCLAGVCDPL